MSSNMFGCMSEGAARWYLVMQGSIVIMRERERERERERDETKIVTELYERRNSSLHATDVLVRRG